MTTIPISVRRYLPLMLLAAVSATGCGAPEARFHTNVAYVRRQEKVVNEQIQPQQVDNITNIVTAFFGTPDDPHVPVVPDVDVIQVMDPDKIRLASGPVHSTRDGLALGLYREHCVHCHGISGDGAGPTAPFLNPYPRDFRKGVFKFKSTPKGGAPTEEDLRTILHNGIPGTAMPSFRLLNNDQIDALIHYVRYLSIRGEVERRLIEESGDLDVEERLLDVELQRTDPAAYAQQLEHINEVIARFVRKWTDAPEMVTQIQGRPEGWDDPETLKRSIEHGRELFYGAVANCVKCHGDSGLGDGQADDYDDWTKDLFAIDPSTKLPDPEEVPEFESLGALPPRNIIPRNLRHGVFRGGRRPIDLYWRIHNGIDGTPMPGASMKPEGDLTAKGLTQEDLWSIIDYVRHLPNEPISRADGGRGTGQRQEYQMERPL